MLCCIKVDKNKNYSSIRLQIDLFEESRYDIVFS